MSSSSTDDSSASDDNKNQKNTRLAPSKQLTDGSAEDRAPHVAWQFDGCPLEERRGGGLSGEALEHSCHEFAEAWRHRPLWMLWLSSDSLGRMLLLQWTEANKAQRPP